MNYLRLQGRVHSLIKKNGTVLNFRREVDDNDPLSTANGFEIQSLNSVYLNSGGSTFLQSLLEVMGQGKVESSKSRLLISPIGLKWTLSSGNQVYINSEWLTLQGVDVVSPDLKTSLLIKANLED